MLQHCIGKEKTGCILWMSTSSEWIPATATRPDDHETCQGGLRTALYEDDIKGGRGALTRSKQELQLQTRG